MTELIKKIVQIPKKYPVFSILTALFGILLIPINEGGATPLMLSLGVVLLILITLRIVGIFLLGERGLASSVTLFVCIGALLFAVSLIASPQESFASVSSLCGIYLSLVGGVGLFRLCLYRSPTYLAILGIVPLSGKRLATISALYTVTLACGIYLLYFTAGNSSNIPCSVALILSGVCSTVACFLKIGGATFTNSKPNDGYIEASFEDKTDGQ